MSKKVLFPVIFVVLAALIGGGYYGYTQFFASPYNYPLVEQKFSFDEPVEADVMKVMKKETKTISSLTNNNSSAQTAPEPIPERKYAQFVPKFAEVEIPFTHKYSNSNVQITGGSLIDTNNDGVDEVFICGGEGQEDGLMFFQDNKFTDKIGGTGLSNTVNCYGSFVVDFIPHPLKT